MSDSEGSEDVENVLSHMDIIRLLMLARGEGDSSLNADEFESASSSGEEDGANDSDQGMEDIQQIVGEPLRLATTEDDLSEMQRPHARAQRPSRMRTRSSRSRGRAFIGDRYDLDDPSSSDSHVATGKVRRQLSRPACHEIFTDSELRSQIMDRCSPRVHNTALNIHSLLRKRSLGQLHRPERTAILSRYLPVYYRTVLHSHSSRLFCGTFSEDGTMFMSACQDDTLRLHDATSSEFALKKSVMAHDCGWAVIDTCYSPDKHFLIYSGWSPYIRLITLDGDRQEALFLNPSEQYSVCPFSIRFSQDSREIIAGTNLCSVYTYDCIADRRTLEVYAHDDDINAVCFIDQSSNIFATGSDDRLCKIWDRRTLSEAHPRPIGVNRGHAQGITYLDGMGDGQNLLSQSKDHTIKLWDLRLMSDAETRAPQGGQFDYRYGAYQPRTHRRIAGDTSVMTYSGHQVARTLIRARFSPAHTTGQRYIYSGSADGCVVIYEVLSGKAVAAVRAHDSVCRDVSWHPHKPEIISSGWDGNLVRLSLRGTGLF